MKSILLPILLIFVLNIYAQKTDDEQIKQIYQNALNSKVAYNHLNELCNKAPGRLVGSKASEIAIQLLKNQIMEIQPDTCYLQNYATKSWRCNSPAQAFLINKGKKNKLNVVNLGLSASTPTSGVTAEIVEVHSMKELDSLGNQAIKGKIVFYNRPMNNGSLTTFEAYGGAIDQRSIGANKASQLGAVGVIVRSLATELDNFPHTGVSHIADGIKEIPNLSISTNDAEKLSELMRQNHSIKVKLISQTEKLENVQTSNIIAEIKGSYHPEKIILIGAHIDSWFNTPGAHDDGAGCEQMMDIFRIFKELDIKPIHTIRLVLFMDEEMYQSGAAKYATFVGNEKREHIACIESDGGGSLPLGFNINANETVIHSIQQLTKALTDYGVFQTIKGHGGVDINPLKQYGYPIIGLMTNSQRYFEYHHSANDTFDKISSREMQLGTASVASLVYLIDKYGISKSY